MASQKEIHNFKAEKQKSQMIWDLILNYKGS